MLQCTISCFRFDRVSLRGGAYLLLFLPTFSLENTFLRTIQSKAVLCFHFLFKECQSFCSSFIKRLGKVVWRCQSQFLKYAENLLSNPLLRLIQRRRCRCWDKSKCSDLKRTVNTVNLKVAILGTCSRRSWARQEVVFLSVLTAYAPHKRTESQN